MPQVNINPVYNVHILWLQNMIYGINVNLWYTTASKLPYIRFYGVKIPSVFLFKHQALMVFEPLKLFCIVFDDFTSDSN